MNSHGWGRRRMASTSLMRLYSTHVSIRSSVNTPPAFKKSWSASSALSALEADNDFLKAGGVFTDDLIETHIAYKREHEIDAIRLRPHPYEFALYYDI